MKKKGQLILRREGYSGRYRTLVDGEEIRICVPLGTSNRAVARAKLDRLIAGEAQPREITAQETFEQAAARLVPGQGISSAPERMSRLRRFAFPEFGKKPVTEVRAGDIRGALELMASKGRSKASVEHLLKDINSVMSALWRDELLPENPAKRVQVPKTAKVDKRARVILTDAELMRLLAWPKLRPDLAVMCVVARCVGGMRTSDLHAWDWSHIDTVTWRNVLVPRPKTCSTSLLELPAVAIPPLRDWWERSKRPESGPVFPVQRGIGAGKRRGRISHALRLRAALWSAGVRRGATKETCPLQTHTEATKRVDFHSFRRKYNTALAVAGVNVQTAMKLAGHRNASTHMLYVQLTEATATPDAALPRALSVPILDTMHPTTYQNRSQNQAGVICQSSKLTAGNQSLFLASGTDSDEVKAGESRRCLQTVPASRAADEAVRAYLKALADEVVS